MKITKRETGIFTRVTKTPKGWREMEAAFLKMAAQPVTIYTIMAEWEKEALQILRSHGFKQYPGAIPAETPQALRDALTDPEVEDAMELMREIWSARTDLKENKAEEAARHAFIAGHIATRMTVRPHEPRAKVGRAALSNLEKGRSPLKDRYAAARRRNAEWVKYYKTLNPRLSQMRRCDMVRDHFNNPMHLSNEEKPVTTSAVKKAIQNSPTK